ncbi:MAG: cbb3-type cytochrome oxidase assembly protein CcoS [Thermodesulfovibrionales bacterium]
MWTIIFLVILALCLGLGAWFLFLWAVKSGQYEDTERPKYRMLEDEEEKKRDESRL